jgi:hypothetical protein
MFENVRMSLDLEPKSNIRRKNACKKGVSASRAEVIFARNVAAFDSDSTQTKIGISCNTISYLSAVSVHIQESTTNNDDQGSQVHFDIVDNLEMGDAESVDHIQNQDSPTYNNYAITVEEIELPSTSERPTAATVTSASVPMEVPSE